MTDTRQPTCEERIDDNLAGRLADFAKIMDQADDGREDAYERWDELPLSIDTKLEVTVLLSWGGPQDEFVLSVNPEDRSIGAIRYRFLDWFDGATRTLEGEQYETARDFLSYFTEVI